MVSANRKKKYEHPFCRQVARTIDKYKMLEPNESVLVCLSGGADSVALFCVLASLREKLGLRNIYALHVNHMLRDSAIRDEEFVAGLCKDFGIPLKIHREDVKQLSKTLKTGIEEAARHVRYFQAEIAAGCFGASKIAVAHNKNDNGETLLLNLCRGSGLRGLGGIPAVNGIVVRPLLMSSRDEILAYLHEYALSHVTDESNNCNDYTRNRVRNIVLPELAKKVNPKAAYHFAETACLLAIDEDYLSREAKKAFADCMVLEAMPGGETACSGFTQGNLKINAKKINELHYSVSSRVMRLVLEGFGAEVSQAGISALLELSKGKSGKVYKAGKVYAVKKYTYVEFMQEIPKKIEFCKKIPLESPTQIPEIGIAVFVSRQNFYDFPHTYCTKLIKCDNMSGSFEIRSRRCGDRIRLETKEGRLFTKKLQDFFTDMKIPAPERDLIPLFVVDGEIGWIIMDTGKKDPGITAGSFKADGSKDFLYVTIGGL